jgi:type IV secretion system protein VirB9
VPSPGARDPRIRTAPYHAEEVYRLHGFVGYEIELEFEPGERFAGQGGGDLEAIAFAAHEHYLILKPRAASVRTNLVVYTDRRAYRIDYTASARPPDPATDEIIYTVRFLYPPPIVDTGPSIGERVESELADAPHSRPRNIDYWFCGDRSIKPVAASDDGVHTRLTFGARTELPALFVRNEDGSDSLLNFSVEAGDVVIHRVARAFVLRRGKSTGCVVNKAFAGSGERLDSGTIAPGVRRERKAVPP